MYQYRITHKHWNSSTTFHNFETKEEAAESAKKSLLHYYALQVDDINTTWENENYLVEIEEQATLVELNDSSEEEPNE